MPAFRVFLQCTSPTLRPGGVFHTLVHVSEDDLADGAHLRAACRRAAILGFGGPHHVVEVRHLDSPTQAPADATVIRERPEDAQDRMATRLLAVIDSSVEEPASRQSDGPSSDPPRSFRRRAVSGLDRDDDRRDLLASRPHRVW